jgi:hypothetical protein
MFIFCTTGTATTSGNLDMRRKRMIAGKTACATETYSGHRYKN